MFTSFLRYQLCAPRQCLYLLFILMISVTWCLLALLLNCLPMMPIVFCAWWYINTRLSTVLSGGHLWLVWQLEMGIELNNEGSGSVRVRLILRSGSVRFDQFYGSGSVRVRLMSGSEFLSVQWCYKICIWWWVTLTPKQRTKCKPMTPVLSPLSVSA